MTFTLWVYFGPPPATPARRLIASGRLDFVIDDAARLLAWEGARLVEIHDAKTGESLCQVRHSAPVRPRDHPSGPGAPAAGPASC